MRNGSCARAPVVQPARSMTSCPSCRAISLIVAFSCRSALQASHYSTSGVSQVGRTWPNGSTKRDKGRMPPSFKPITDVFGVENSVQALWAALPARPAAPGLPGIPAHGCPCPRANVTRMHRCCSSAFETLVSGPGNADYGPPGTRRFTLTRLPTATWPVDPGFTPASPAS